MKLDEVFSSAMSFGDVHEDGSDSDMNIKLKLISFIAREKPPLLVIAGDNLDRWKASWDDLEKTIFCQELKNLIRERTNKCMMTVTIAKNHDHGIPKRIFKDVANSYWYYEANNLIATVGKHTYKWMHGWEYDIAWGGIGNVPGIYPIAFWIAEHAPWLMIPLYRRLFGQNSSPGVGRAVIESDIPFLAETSLSTEAFEADLEQWNWHVAMIHDRARADVKKDGIYRILQHTHYPWAFDGMICDGGGFLWDHTFVHVTDWPRLRKVDEDGTDTD